MNSVTCIIYDLFAHVLRVRIIPQKLARTFKVETVSQVIFCTWSLSQLWIRWANEKILIFYNLSINSIQFARTATLFPKARIKKKILLSVTHAQTHESVRNKERKTGWMIVKQACIYGGSQGLSMRKSLLSLSLIYLLLTLTSTKSPIIFSLFLFFFFSQSFFHSFVPVSSSQTQRIGRIPFTSRFSRDVMKSRWTFSNSRGWRAWLWLRLRLWLWLRASGKMDPGFQLTKESAADVFWYLVARFRGLWEVGQLLVQHSLEL